MEAIKVQIENPFPGMWIKYQAHVQGIGWQDWVYDGQIAGTVGENRRLEAIKVVLEGAPAQYRVKYQAHVQTGGWQDWKYDGQVAGTEGEARRIEAIRIRNVNEAGTGLEQSEITQVRSISNNGDRIFYTYNSNGNIKTIAEDGKRIEYFYDELNQLIRENNGVLNKTVVYAYDAGGNLLSRTEYPLSDGELSEPTKVYPYSYEDANYRQEKLYED